MINDLYNSESVVNVRISKSQLNISSIPAS